LKTRHWLNTEQIIAVRFGPHETVNHTRDAAAAIKTEPIPTFRLSSLRRQRRAATKPQTRNERDAELRRRANR